ncbi:MAG: gamma-glutamyl-gamma-aminobutyrate hydrolase family protein [Gemmatimonadaceae bacterium]
MSRPPLVAVTATARTDNGVNRVRLNTTYTAAVERAGGIPLVIPPVARAAEAARLVGLVDALLLTGGEDVDPARYGEAPHATVSDINAVRDETEIALVQAARASGTPTLAICRGIQLLNVAFGGSLVQDIPGDGHSAAAHHPDAPRTRRVHEVIIQPGSRLAATLGATRMQVNSIHHQAPGRVAADLAVSARAPDDIIEGLEWPGTDWWAIGVQWHPEELDGADLKLFASLVEQARLRAQAAV